MTRHVRLEGVENFRDFGDYPGAGGGRLRRSALYRSASHGRATDADLEAIAALGLAAIVDLRRPGERLRDPARRPVGFAGAVIEDQEDEAPDTDPWRTFVNTCDLSEAAFRGYLLDYYRAAPFVPRHLGLFARYFEVLAEAQGPVLIHCAAGKDRTGILAALTHLLAGVHRDDMLADYLLTNDPTRMSERAPVVARQIAEETGRAPSEAAVRAAIGVEAEYLEAALAAIDAAYGSTGAYLEAALGVDAGRREALHARLMA